ncbi:hypothetical protein GOODEAATRI_008824 [Goodea atripinnis]|uniref:Uncharacterized protein n=1 Tax=Goodea atripinnis TaxID=208336 RepID=A0ABV0P538_9TELE
MRQPAVICVSRAFITKQRCCLSGDEQLCFCNSGGRLLASNGSLMKNTCSVMMPRDHFLSLQHLLRKTCRLNFWLFWSVCLLSLWAAEGTRLAKSSCEKSVFINMHSHKLPLKRAFVAQQMLKHIQKR